MRSRSGCCDMLAVQESEACQMLPHQAYLTDELSCSGYNVRSHGSCELLLAIWQCLTLMVISHASLAVEGKSKARLQHVLSPPEANFL